MYWRFIQLWWYKGLFQSKTWAELKCNFRGKHKIRMCSSSSGYDMEPHYYCDDCWVDMN